MRHVIELLLAVAGWQAQAGVGKVKSSMHCLSFVKLDAGTPHRDEESFA